MSETLDRTLGLPRGRALVRDDLDDLPDDGHRYELLDGTLVVTPSPLWRHQEQLGNLYLLMKAACPPALAVGQAPFDIVLADDTVLIPDLWVARRADITQRELPVAPLLTVEVLSPSTRRYDLLTKRSRYEEAGVASYWVLDPGRLALTAWDLVDGRYVEVAQVSGDEAYDARLPFAVTVRPGALLD